MCNRRIRCHLPHDVMKPEQLISARLTLGGANHLFHGGREKHIDELRPVRTAATAAGVRS